VAGGRSRHFWEGAAALLARLGSLMDVMKQVKITYETYLALEIIVAGKQKAA
jgi:hypothetical protein